MTTSNELQCDLTTIEDWADKWKVKFNPLKSEGLLISRRFNRFESLFTFQNHTLFADNTTISKHITNQMTTSNELQCDLTTIEDWADKWKVKFNPL